MLYSVSPRLNLTMVGLKPSWNFRTRIPTRLAARKWPSSWTKTSTPSTNTNASGICIHCGSRSSRTSANGVIKTATSDFQFYCAGDLLRILACPPVNSAHGCKRRHLFRPMDRHRLFDDVGDREEADPPVEEPLDGNLVGRIQDDRQAACVLEGAVGQRQAGERGGVRHLELQAASARQIERRQR